jgi:plasmid stabilization system protein ParE
MVEQALWWAKHRSIEQAFRWTEGFEQSLASLAESPERCIVARESGVFDFVLRELHYGIRRKATHRAVFEVRSDEVIVHSIRHLAQGDLTAGDLE